MRKTTEQPKSAIKKLYRQLVDRLARPPKDGEWRVFTAVGQVVDYCINYHPLASLWLIWGVWVYLYSLGAWGEVSRDYSLYSYYALLGYTIYKVVRKIYGKF